MNRLKEIREKRGKTQKEVADFLGRTVSTYANYESERRDMDTDTLLVLAEYFDVTTDYILGRAREEELKSKENENATDDLLLKEAYRIAAQIQQLPRFRRAEARRYIEFLLSDYKEEGNNSD